jgi:hypothetical protein
MATERNAGMILHYEAPQITTLGTVADLTQGNSTGPNTDAAFPVNTPRGELTFS